ncbi:MAG: DUF2269 domain-containing protein [Candidatus Rokubacteria bacterium]|nr:DUF2269 domain-containing protein [Candidatus Rokubacteria bacterium]
MTPGLRKFVLAVHLILSVGWIGAVVAYIALDVTAVTSQDVQMVRAAFLAMELTALYVIVPLALAALLTGLVMSLGTPWGLFRHYWVLITLVLTIIATIVLLLETQTISYMAEVAASGADPRELPGSLPHSVGGLVVLLVITVLNVYKPRGLTPYGWRKQQEERRKQHEERTVLVP